MTGQDALVAEVLDGFTPVGGEVPSEFEAFVLDRIAARPSPAAPADPLAAIVDKLDEILALLRGNPE